MATPSTLVPGRNLEREPLHFLSPLYSSPTYTHPHDCLSIDSALFPVGLIGLPMDSSLLPVDFILLPMNFTLFPVDSYLLPVDSSLLSIDSTFCKLSQLVSQHLSCLCLFMGQCHPSPSTQKPSH